jgi:hypothetical protein
MYLPFRNVNGFLTYYSPLLPGIPPLSSSNFYPPATMGASSSGATLSNVEGPAQLRKLFIGGLTHETTDEQVKIIL